MNKAYDEMKQVCKTGDDPYLPGDLISEDEVISIIKQSKRRKACGSDMIQNEHLIFGCPKVIKCLTIFLINVIGKAYVPKEWRRDLLFLYLKVAINRKHTLTATDRCVYYQVC
jgi:hypothetical protein